MRLSDEKLLDRWEEAEDDHERVTRWKRETRSADEKRQLRNRQWTIRKRINKYNEEFWRRVGEWVSGC